MFSNRITRLFNIEYPIVQAGMVWASGWRLASAVSNAGGAWNDGCRQHEPDSCLRNILKNVRQPPDKPFGVNLPLLYTGVEQQIEIVIRNKVNIVVTSAGNPSTFTGYLKHHGIKVMHVVSSSRFAKKAEQAGCDAVIAEGFEAGGHNGREETTTMVLIPLVCESVQIPVIAAGGIATGRQMLACMVLGAEGVQMGSRFVASDEASSHPDFKNAVVQAKEGDTILTLKELTPVRMMKNDFYNQIKKAYEEHAGIRTITGTAWKSKGEKRNV